MWEGGAGPLLAAGICLAVAVAIVMEVAVLREARLGVVYIAVLGVESVLVMAAAHGLFAESFTARELAGAGLVLVGVAVMSV